jgi:hypothetical protein
MIDEIVGRPNLDPIPDYVKALKPSLPSPHYSGADDIEVFEVWLNRLLEYFATLHLVGPAHDRTRVRVSASALSGDAATWYYNNISSPSRLKRDWTFVEAMVGLHRRYIYADPNTLAMREFKNLAFDAEKGGVAGVYDRLMRAVERMTMQPDEMTMKRRFIAALPGNYPHSLTLIQGLRIEQHSFVEYYQGAINLERDMSALEELLEDRKEHKHASRTNASQVATNVVASTNRTNANTHSNTNKSAPSSNQSKFARPAYQQGRSNRPSQYGLSNSVGPSRRTPNTGQRPFIRPENTGQSAFSRPANAQSGNSKPPISVKCYACGQIGHYSSDPKCPKYGTPSRPPGTQQRLFAQRVLDDRDDDRHQQDNNHALVVDEQAGPGNDQVYEEEPPPDEIVGNEGGEDQGLPESDNEWLGGGRQYDPDDGYVTEDWNDAHDAAEEIFGNVYHGSMRVTHEPQGHHSSVGPSTVQSYQMSTSGADSRTKTAWLYDPRVRRLRDPANQPSRDPRLQRPICAEVHVNGIPAYTLFDSACTTDMISPELAYIAHADRVDLTEQMGLQLGTKGSRSRINYGAVVDIEYQNTNERRYFDVVDIDKYDLILGTVFCREHDIWLDLANDQIQCDGHWHPAYTAGQEEELLQSRIKRRQKRIFARMDTSRSA